MFSSTKGETSVTIPTFVEMTNAAEGFVVVICCAIIAGFFLLVVLLTRSNPALKRDQEILAKVEGDIIRIKLSDTFKALRVRHPLQESEFAIECFVGESPHHQFHGRVGRAIYVKLVETQILNTFLVNGKPSTIIRTTTLIATVFSASPSHHTYSLVHGEEEEIYFESLREVTDAVLALARKVIPDSGNIVDLSEVRRKITK